MSRFFPHPLLSLALTAMWLLLTRFSLGNLLLGAAIALIAGWAMGALHPRRVRLRRWDLLAKLLCIVTWDILKSNATVAWAILTNGRGGKRRSGFVCIPLELRSINGLALLAIILTATPGTAWLEHDQDSGLLLLHVFDLRDGDDWSGLIRNRYEAPLLEIFG
ncbi:cation:proton antiporter [Cypionkella aquatica]|uniref:Cation:proton antiporter n=1 Tax=Cypionkella aquatica TaxID=1756042 RepID=A0AA37U7E2_9RHOB|nr:Na+/H+ antiporter subunit E [Cypionkella aquatica]GLS88075.1 cation:proton antiporter [Cypionkella aquatica]GLS88432.1 cation:proton antiporter [Cypionkella aquatica]